MLIDKIKTRYSIVSDVVDLKPRLKDKKADDRLKAKDDARAIDFGQARADISTSNTYAYEYELVITVPVPAALIRDKKQKGTGDFVSQLHDFVDQRIGKWMGTPTIGGLKDRAKKGMLNVQAKWYFDDAFLAYSLGLDLTETWGRAPVVDKSQIPMRRNLAEKAAKELGGYKKLVQKKLALRTKDEDERNRIWKEEFMDGYIKLADKYEKKGIAHYKLRDAA